jgi:hypothetical protein
LGKVGGPDAFAEYKSDKIDAMNGTIGSDPREQPRQAKGEWAHRGRINPVNRPRLGDTGMPWRWAFDHLADHVQADELRASLKWQY